MIDYTPLKNDKSALQWELDRHGRRSAPPPSDNQLGMVALLGALLVGALIGLVVRWLS